VIAAGSQWRAIRHEHQRLIVVEAAGVEPASENAAGKEPTYLVTFLRRC